MMFCAVFNAIVFLVFSSAISTDAMENCTSLQLNAQRYSKNKTRCINADEMIYSVPPRISSVLSLTGALYCLLSIWYQNTRRRCSFHLKLVSYISVGDLSISATTLLWYSTTGDVHDAMMLLIGFSLALTIGLHSLMATAMLSVIRNPVQHYAPMLRGENPFKRVFAAIYGPLVAFSLVGIITNETFHGTLTFDILLGIYCTWVVFNVIFINTVLFYVVFSIMSRSAWTTSIAEMHFRVIKLFSVLTAAMWLSWAWCLAYLADQFVPMMPHNVSASLSASYQCMFPLGGLWNALVFQLYVRSGKKKKQDAGVEPPASQPELLKCDSMFEVKSTRSMSRHSLTGITDTESSTRNITF